MTSLATSGVSRAMVRAGVSMLTGGPAPDIPPFISAALPLLRSFIVTSDCGAVGAVMFDHKYTNTTSATVKAVLQAGMDSNCDYFLLYNVNGSLNDHSISMTDVDTTLSHLFGVQFRLGRFDPPESQPFLKYDAKTMIGSPAHQELALFAAKKSVVLLKNLVVERHLKVGVFLSLPGPLSLSVPYHCLPLACVPLLSPEPSS